MRRFRTFGETKKRGGIPSDCYEVEYLRGDGNSYIKTDISANYSAILGVGDIASAEMDVMYESATGCALGVAGVTPIYANASRWRLENVGAYSYYAWNLMEVGKRKTVRWDVTIANSSGYNYQSLYVDGEQEASRGNTRLVAPSIAGEDWLYIGATITTDGNILVSPSLRVYSLKHTIKGTTTADLVPVRRVENGVSVGYMCDRLTGKLYGNAGTGAFVIGPDKYDSEVEYLESVEERKAGSQITFPVGARATFECKLHIFDTRDLKFMGLMYNEGGAYQGCFQISTILGGYRTQQTFMGTLSVDTPPVDTTRPIVYKSPDPNHLYWTIDGVQYPVGACRWNTAGNFHLFHAGVLNYWNDKGRNRLYWCKVYEDGVLTHDFIPVRYRGVGYMYDNVSGRLFGNQGSGEFVIGADVKHAKDYVQAGLVAMWDGIENAGYGVHDESATYWTDLVSGLRMSALSDSYYRPGDMYGSFTTQCTQTIPKELWGGDHIKNLTQSVLVDMDSVASNAFFTLLYCYASPAAYRYGINTNASRRLTGDHLTMLSTDDSALYTQGIHRFDHVVSENTSGGTDEKLYIDGVEIVSARKTTAFSATETTQMRFYFYANIRAYNMMHYKRALTDAEIAANYAVDKARFGI